jgi:hypothetical protein
MFTIAAPHIGFPLKIDAEDFSDAAKKAIKLNQEVQIMSMIINDHTKNMRMLANVDYYNQDGRRKAGVKMAKTKALGYQGYPPISPIIVGISTNERPSDIGPFLIPMGVNGLPILPFPGPMAINGRGGPAIVAGPGAFPYGPFGAALPPGAIPFFSSIGFSSSDSIESLEKKVTSLTGAVAGKTAALATPGISVADTDKYKREEASLKADLVKVQVRLAELKAKNAAKPTSS